MAYTDVGASGESLGFYYSQSSPRNIAYFGELLKCYYWLVFFVLYELHSEPCVIA